MEENLLQYIIFDKTFKYEGYKIYHIDIKVKGFENIITLNPTYYTWDKCLNEVQKILNGLQLEYKIVIYDEENIHKTLSNY